MSDRRTGKIARLPHSVRTLVNEMIRDGRPYREIIAWLKKEHGVEVLDQNLSNWREGGHADWLNEQERLMKMAHQREFAMELARQNEGSKIHEAGLHLAASQIYEVLSEYDLSDLKELVSEKPENYPKLVNAVTKLAKGNVEVQQYKDRVAEQKRKILAETKQAAKTGGISKETQRVIEEAAGLL